MARRVRHDLAEVQEKRARVIELRAQGLNWTAIAAATGYSDASAASKAWHAAIQQRPDQAVDKIRAEAADRLEYLYAENVKLIKNPGPRVGATSKVAVYPADHPRAGEMIEDESIRARALDNARKAIADYVRVTGAELAPARSLETDRAAAQASLNQIRARREAELADIARREAEVTARERAITAAISPQDGDDDVVDAEVIN